MSRSSFVVPMQRLAFEPAKFLTSCSQNEFSQTGFQPQDTQDARVSSEDLKTLRDVVARARESLEAAEEILKKLEFQPVASNDPGFDRA